MKKVKEEVKKEVKQPPEVKKNTEVKKIKKVEPEQDDLEEFLGGVNGIAKQT